MQSPAPVSRDNMESQYSQSSHTTLKSPPRQNKSALENLNEAISLLGPSPAAEVDARDLMAMQTQHRNNMAQNQRAPSVEPRYVVSNSLISLFRKFRGNQHAALPPDSTLYPIVAGIYAASTSARVPSNKAIVSLLGSRYNIHISCKTLERRVCRNACLTFQLVSWDLSKRKWKARHDPRFNNPQNSTTKSAGPEPWSAGSKSSEQRKLSSASLASVITQRIPCDDPRIERLISRFWDHPLRK
jgi:hypothetical protein